MSSFISRPYLLDLEIVKSAGTSQTSSPSSTLSDSGNSPVAISTRKSRAPRKRPNQTYNEAAAILSTAYPSVFSVKQVANPRKFCKSGRITGNLLLCDPSDSLLPFGAFDDSVFVARRQAKDPSGYFSPRGKYSCQSSGSTTTTSANTWEADSMEVCGGRCDDGDAADFDAESILDEEMEEGIDSILGNLSVFNDQSADDWRMKSWISSWDSWCPGPIGLSLGGRNQFGMKSAVAKALRSMNRGSSLHSPIVDMTEISPKLTSGENSNSISNLNSKSSSKKKTSPAEKKKKKKTEKPTSEPDSPIETSSSHAKIKWELNLKLNYDVVLAAWSDRGLPFPEGIPAAEGTDVSARLAQIDLFSENEVLREASVLRYKEKRRTRLFSKKIRYHVRKVNADQRPRMKGRFMRRGNGGATVKP